MTHGAGYKLRHQGKRFTEKTWEKIKERYTWEDAPEPEQPKAKGESPKAQKEKASTSKTPAVSHEPHASENNTPDNTAHGHDLTWDNVRWSTERTSSNYAGKETRQNVKTVERGMKQSGRASEKAVKTSAKGSIRRQNTA